MAEAADAKARKEAIDRKKAADKFQANVDAEQGIEIPTRRARMLMVNPTDFMFLFTKGLVFRKGWKLLEGIPEDAKLLGVAYDSTRNGIMLVVESEEYEPVPINVLVPVQMVQIDVLIKNPTKKKVVPRKKRK
jgi:hypothetical protein